MAPTAICRSSSVDNSMDQEIKELDSHGTISNEIKIDETSTFLMRQMTIKSKKEEKNAKTAVMRDRENRFQIRESVFTTAVKNDSAVRSMYSFVVAGILYHLMTQSIKYSTIDGFLAEDLAFLQRAFGQFYWVIVFELSMLATFVLMILPVVQSQMRDTIHPFLYHANLLVDGLIILIIPLYIRYEFDLHPVMATIVTFEQIRYAMKSISFVIENQRFKAESLIQSNSNSNDGEEYDDEVFTHELQVPTIKSLLYFLFAPTLIYQHSYPMCDSRDWKNILCWSCEILALMWSSLTVLNHGFMDCFSKIGLEPVTPNHVSSMYTWGAILGFHAMVGIGYGFLHCWNNIFAELLYFGDRMFYKNFFSASNPLSMFSMWNYLIHSWIVQYLFKPSIKWSGSRQFAIMYSFMISMAFHDWAVNFPLKIFSLHNVAAIGTVILLTPIIKLVDDFITKHPIPSTLNVNVFFITCLAIPNMTAVFASKYFWQANCPTSQITFPDLINTFPDTRVCYRGS